jgi:hypothetical protein
VTVSAVQFPSYQGETNQYEPYQYRPSQSYNPLIWYGHGNYGYGQPSYYGESNYFPQQTSYSNPNYLKHVKIAY